MIKIIKLYKHYSKMESKLYKTQTDIENLLKENKIEFKTYPHKAALTIDDLKQDPGKFEKSPFIKNLVYSDKKKNVYYIAAHCDTMVGKNIWSKVGTSKNKVRFSSEKTLTYLQTKKGAVNIFAILNDVENKIKKIMFDSKLEKEEYWNLHPQSNEASIELLKSDLLKLLEKSGREYQFYDLVDVEGEVVEKPINPKQKPQKKKKKEKKHKKKQENEETNPLKIEADKKKDFANWYTQVINKAELIDYYNISGCYILKPNSYYLWEQIQKYLDTAFKTKKVKNVYFPMFVSKKNLEAEETHLDGFQAEVAWVTHSGKSKLNEPIAIRPTSETIMYPAFANWIHSHRDLPLLLNQWTNIVRWEFKHPTPFIRTREFLWQEGHTAHATKEESVQFVYDILDIYSECYSDLLAVPVIKGVKSENEKFAGADFTTTCETFIPENGRAIQACTSHNLGQNFAKIFGVSFLNKDMKKELVYQTSWGFTTRSIGIVVMVHGDNKGLVMPPKIAPVQVVIVPVFFTNFDKDLLLKRSEEVLKLLEDAGVRAELDDRDTHSSGYKYNEWELKGVPIRLEIGPKDYKNEEVRLVRRVDGKKMQVKTVNLIEEAKNQLEDIHNTMLKNADLKMKAKIKKARNWKEFMLELNKMQIVETPWCKNSKCEDDVKETSGIESKENQDGEGNLSGKAKTLCMPIEQSELKEEDVCFRCGEKAQTWVLWGRSY